jgi:tRNA U34 2-thiouridine synthase MnmA/TrmU
LVVKYTLGIQVNFVKEYWNEVFSPFLDSYRTGVETPNPDAFCNRQVKFGHLKKYVNHSLGISMIATGHYSRTVLPTVPVTVSMADNCSSGTTESISGINNVQLLKGVDPLKDQSYFLCLTKV